MNPLITFSVCFLFSFSLNYIWIGMVKELTGGYKIKYHANGLENDPIEIDFTPPFRSLESFFFFHFLNAVFTLPLSASLYLLECCIHSSLVLFLFRRRIDMIEELEKMANLNIPKDLASDEANKYLINACASFDIKCPPPQTTARLLDKVSHLCVYRLMLLFSIGCHIISLYLSLFLHLYCDLKFDILCCTSFTCWNFCYIHVCSLCHNFFSKQELSYPTHILVSCIACWALSWGDLR